MNLFIDTSVFIDVLRSKQVESSKSLFKSLQESSNKGFASVITVAELSVGAYRSPRKDALEKTLKLLSIVNVVDLSRETVEGGRIYAELMKKGEGIELNDCLIAATSLSLGIHDIGTRDTGHFNRIENIRAVTPEDLGF